MSFDERQHVASRRRHGAGLLIHCSYGFLPLRSHYGVLREKAINGDFDFNAR